MSNELISRGKVLGLDKCRVMGVLNVTPDSLFGGQGTGAINRARTDLDKVVAVAKGMVQEGASILDVGGESTGPGSVDVNIEEELRRVVPVFELLRRELPDVWISVDTYKSEVALASLNAGADMINDVTALRGGGEGMGRIIAESGVPVVLMYSKDPTARTSREGVEYDDVVADIILFLRERIEFAESCGILKSQIIVDPGMGAFVSGKGEYSMEILRRLREFEVLGCPILVGTSRKGFVGEMMGGAPVDQRLEGSVETAMTAIQNGANIVRVHDVRETVEAIVGAGFNSPISKCK